MRKGNEGKGKRKEGKGKERTGGREEPPKLKSAGYGLAARVLTL